MIFYRETKKSGAEKNPLREWMIKSVDDPNPLQQVDVPATFASIGGAVFPVGAIGEVVFAIVFCPAEHEIAIGIGAAVRPDRIHPVVGKRGRISPLRVRHVPEEEFALHRFMTWVVITEWTP